MATRAPTPASWRPGQTGNPAGRPRKGETVAELIDAATNNGKLPISRLAEVVRTGRLRLRRAVYDENGQRAKDVYGHPAFSYVYLEASTKDILQAADSLIDRRFGKPAQTIVNIGETPQQRALEALLTLFGAPASVVEGEAMPALSEGDDEIENE